jgi:hypothetical protein
VVRPVLPRPHSGCIWRPVGRHQVLLVRWTDPARCAPWVSLDGPANLPVSSPWVPLGASCWLPGLAGQCGPRRVSCGHCQVTQNIHPRPSGLHMAAPREDHGPRGQWVPRGVRRDFPNGTKPLAHGPQRALVAASQGDAAGPGWPRGRVKCTMAVVHRLPSSRSPPSLARKLGCCRGAVFPWGSGCRPQNPVLLLSCRTPKSSQQK